MVQKQVKQSESGRSGLGIDDESGCPWVEASIGVVNGGIGINLTWYYVTGDNHWDLMSRIKLELGFGAPATVNFIRNKQGADGQWSVDWNRLRIASDECELAGVSPAKACMGLREWLSSPGKQSPEKLYGIRFRVAEKISL